MKNACIEIAECLELTSMIQMRIINDNLEESTKIFLNLVEALYEKELGLVND